MEAITLEIRPQLRSLNAYISLIQDIDKSTIKVKLVEDAIIIQIKEKTYNLPLSNVKLLPTSLSSLGITNSWISFRIQTQPNVLFGTFETEVIDNKNKANYGFLNISSDLQLPPKNKNCKILCTCCKNEITKTACFQKILPLPSSDCDPQEWFCHKHGSDEPFTLEPKESDFFYSVNYCLLNKHIFEGSLKLRNSLVHCNRCFSIVGLTNGKELKSLKIWNCCIEYKVLNDKSVISETLSPLTDFLSTIKHTADLIIGEKVLLEAQDINNIHYILLRPMEAKLNVLKEGSVKLEEEIITLESSFVAKVLYKYGESKSTTKHDDPNVKFCELSLPSILAGMDALVTSSKRFPPAYRKAEDYYIGHLPI